MGYLGPQLPPGQVRHFLGVGLAAPEQGAQLDVAATPFIELLISTRTDLRAAKQWTLADKIRNELKTLGVMLEDTPEGVQWRFEQG